MSGARGSARRGKGKLVCIVERTDRSTVRRFRSHIFVPRKEQYEAGEIMERLRRKYDFPLTLVAAVWASPKVRN